MTFVHEECIHAKIAEIHRAVFLTYTGNELLIPGFHLLALFFELFDGGASAVRFLGSGDGLNHSVNLFLKNLLLNVMGHINLGKRAMRHYDGIPVAGGDAAEKPLTVLFGEVGFIGYEDIRAGIERVELIAPLVQKMVRHDHHRLVDKTHALGFHDGSDAGHCFACPHHMVKEGRTFLNGSPDRIFLMRSKLDFRGRTDQRHMRAVIGRGNVRVESLIIELGQSFAPVVIHPYPVKKSLLDFIGLLHGGGSQFLIHNHNGPALVIAASAVHFHLDRAIDEQGFDELACRVFRRSPDTGVQGIVPDADVGLPVTDGREILDLLHTAPLMQMFHELIHDIGRNPCGAELDADVHSLDVGRHGGSKGFHVGSEAGVIRGGDLRLIELGSDVAGKILVAYFPRFVAGIEKDQSLLSEFLLYVINRTAKKLTHSAEVHLAGLTQGDDERVLGAVHMVSSLSGAQHSLVKNGGFFGGGRPRRSSLFSGDFRGNAFVVFAFERLQQRMFGILTHEAAIGLGVQMSIASDKGVVLAVQRGSQSFHDQRLRVRLLGIEKLTQSIAYLNHGNEAQASCVVLYRKRSIILRSELPRHLADHLSALRFNTECALFQSLEIVGFDEGAVFLLLFLADLLKTRNKDVFRKNGKAFRDG